MRTVRMLVLVVVVASAMLLGAMPGSASAATECASESGVRWCNAQSTDYPKTIGWYGYVGHGGGPCGGGNPRGTTFAPDMVGICMLPQPVVVWRWTGAGWSQARLADGTRAYVYPYTAEWRWIYVGGSWYAISASQLTLEWRA